MKRTTLSGALCVLVWGCSGSKDTSSEPTLDAAPTDTSVVPTEIGPETSDVSVEVSDGTSDVSLDSPADTTVSPRHVEVKDGSLQIDGKPTFLYGGDLHYFRVRTADSDPVKSQAMWASSLDQMKSAGMNLVSTYVPWDYHNTADGTWQWTGARDLSKFLSLACERNMWVSLKPGPLITGEWPRGFGTFGAVPAWWKEKHPEALVRTAKGDLWSYSTTGDRDQRQPTYLHPTYLAAVQDYYTRVFAIAKPYLGKCVVAVQVDNETNGYWGDRYGDVDYAETSVSFFRSWSEKKYATLPQLNAAWNTSYPTFASIEPPKSAPGSATSERTKNRWYADWYVAGQAYTQEYLRRLRTMMEDLGVKEPDVLFMTNDSPFSLGFSDIKIRNVLLGDGTIKNPIGIHGLDLYPKQFTTNSDLQDQPFQADYFTILFDRWSDQSRNTGGFAYAAELQGGFYSAPIVGRPNVRPEATDQLLARTIGNGLKGASFYVIQDGLNADNSKYDYAAAIDQSGKTTPRYDVMAKWGKLLAAHGEALLAAKPIRNSVAIVVNGHYQAPQGGVLDDMQRFWANEGPALYGWLKHANIDVDVLDARGLRKSDLAGFKVILYPNPDYIDDETATLLADYASSGGTLVGLLWPGRLNDRFVTSPATARLSTEIFPAKYEGYWVWPNTGRSGTFNVKYGKTDGQHESFWYESQWSTPTATGFTFDTFGWERVAVLGTNGKSVGYTTKKGVNTSVFLGTSVWTRFNQNDYYTLPDAELSRAKTLAQYVIGLGGESPLISTNKTRSLAWVRKDPGAIRGASEGLWVFVINDEKVASTIRVTLNDVAKLGLTPGKSFAYQDVLGGGARGSATGAFEVTLAAYGTAVVRVEP